MVKNDGASPVRTSRGWAHRTLGVGGLVAVLAGSATALAADPARSHDHAHAAKAGTTAAHVHGVVPMTLALEDQTLTLTLEEAPLDGFLGFERAPRTPAEKKAATELLSVLRSGQGLMAPDAQAQCTLQSAQVEAPVLEAAAGTGVQAAAHADLDASYVFTCARAQALSSVDLSGLMKRFPRIQKIELKGVAGAGQFQRVVQRGQSPVVVWRR